MGEHPEAPATRIPLALAVANHAFGTQPDDLHGAWGALLPIAPDGRLARLLAACPPLMFDLQHLHHTVRRLGEAVQRLPKRRAAREAGEAFNEGMDRAFFRFLDELPVEPSGSLDAAKQELADLEGAFRGRYARFCESFEVYRLRLAEGEVAASAVRRVVRTRWNGPADDQPAEERSPAPAAFWDDGSLLLDPSNRVLPLSGFDGDPMAGDFSSAFGAIFDPSKSWVQLDDPKVSLKALRAAKLWRSPVSGKGRGRKAISVEKMNEWLASERERLGRPATRDEACAALGHIYTVRSIKEAFDKADKSLKFRPGYGP